MPACRRACLRGALNIVQRPINRPFCSRMPEPFLLPLQATREDRCSTCLLPRRLRKLGLSAMGSRAASASQVSLGRATAGLPLPCRLDACASGGGRPAPVRQPLHSTRQLSWATARPPGSTPACSLHRRRVHQHCSTAALDRCNHEGAAWPATPAAAQPTAPAPGDRQRCGAGIVRHSLPSACPTLQWRRTSVACPPLTRAKQHAQKARPCITHGDACLAQPFCCCCLRVQCMATRM